jgi:hypothetical protein
MQRDDPASQGSSIGRISRKEKADVEGIIDVIKSPHLAMDLKNEIMELDINLSWSLKRKGLRLLMLL